MTASETLESLRRELAIEEQGATQHPTLQAGAQGGSTIPVMECLRSPTTRTILAIIQNQNHFEVIKDFVLEAKEEERQTQELIDEAEAVQAIPLASAFASQLGEMVKDDQIYFHLPRNAAGDVLGIKAEDSAILKRWGKKPPSTGDDEDDYDAVLAPIERLRGHHKPHETKSEPTAQEGSVGVREMRMPDHDFPGDPVSQKNLHDGRRKEEEEEERPVEMSTRSKLMSMLHTQQEVSVEREKGYQAYSDHMAGYMKWQQNRLDAFDQLLEPFVDLPAPGGATVPGEKAVSTKATATTASNEEKSEDTKKC